MLLDFVKKTSCKIDGPTLEQRASTKKVHSGDLLTWYIKCNVRKFKKEILITFIEVNCND